MMTMAYGVPSAAYDRIRPWYVLIHPKPLSIIAIGRTIDATGIIKVVNKLVYKSIVPLSFRTDAANANVEAAPKTIATVPQVISKLFPKKAICYLLFSHLEAMVRSRLF
jgi:hypothetical protein